MIRVLALMFGFGWSAARGGVDIGGPVQRVHLAADGSLWFVMETTPAATYCLKGWFDFNMYVPKDHPQFPYYYAMLMAAVSKGKSVYVANISSYNGTAPCDVTKTGYGIVLPQ